MPNQLITRWYMNGGALVRRSEPPPPITQFVAFTPGTVIPIGDIDADLGLPRNVGPRTTMTRFDGNITIGAGQVVQGLDIYGTVTFTGQGTIRDCRIRGAVAAIPGAVGGATNRLVEPLASVSPRDYIVSGTSLNLRNSLIEWCAIDARGYESSWMDGLRGGNYTCRYSEIYGSIDGLGMVIVGNGVVEACRIADGFYTAYHDTASGNRLNGFPNQPDHTNHSDGCQMQSYGGWVIRGCNMGGPPSDVTATMRSANRDPQVPSQVAVIRRADASKEFTNACIIVNQIAGNAATGALIEKNWFQGSGAQVNLAATATGRLGAVTVRDNRFRRPSLGFFIYRNANSLATLSNNVYDDTGAPVPIVQYGTLGA